jgi:hypothetical protein
MLEQSGFTRAVRADDPDDSARWHFEAEIIDQQPVAVGFGNIVKFDHFVTQALGRQE